jgi:hypothetical protein
MLDTTVDLVNTAFRTDPTISPRDRRELIKLLRNGGAPPPAAPSSQPQAPLGLTQVVSRARAAKALDRSVRFVDALAQQGLLKKISLPGRKRALGFLAADIEALLTGQNRAAA